jgi:hypothetical protein
MSVSEYALKRSVNAFSRIQCQVISNLRLDWRRTSPIQGKVQSASWTIIAFRIDNQFALVGTVSRLPLHLLPNGTSPMRYEPHLMKWVLLFTQSTHRYGHLFGTQSVLSVHHHINTCLTTGGCLTFLPYCNHASGGGRDLGLVSLCLYLVKIKLNSSDTSSKST